MNTYRATNTCSYILILVRSYELVRVTSNCDCVKRRRNSEVRGNRYRYTRHTRNLILTIQRTPHSLSQCFWCVCKFLMKMMECLANYAGRVEAILLINLLVLPQLLVKMKHKKCAQLFSIVLTTKWDKALDISTQLPKTWGNIFEIEFFGQLI